MKNKLVKFLSAISFPSLTVLLVAALVFVLVYPAMKDSFSKKEKGSVFLFIGDSITDGNWGVKSNTSKRSYKDLNHIYGHGYVFLCASEMMSQYPEKEFVFHNRGISGNTIVDMASRWQTDCLDLQPDVLTVMVGINDACYYQAGNDSVRASLSAQAYETNYRQLLDASLQQNPDLQIILITPFIAPVGKYQNDYDAWYTLVQSYADVVKSLAKDYDASLIDSQKLFEKAWKKHPQTPVSYWVWDGIHPTAAGHSLMAKAWRAAN